MQQSNNNVIDAFKRNYGELNDLQPTDQYLAKEISFEQKAKTGESYIEAVILSGEVGITFGGNGYDAFNINPAVAGVVKQTSVIPYVSVLPSILPWQMASRSAGAGDKSFVDATKHIVKNNLKTHQKLLEIVRLYGQSADKLGRVSYATATYRGVSFTNGTGTLVSDMFGSVAFTNGVNGQYLLMAPGQFAAGIFIALEGIEIVEVDSAGVEVFSSPLLAVDPDLGILKLKDSGIIAASSTTSHRICFRGMESGGEAIGMHNILSTSGTLFGIDNSKYALWKGTKYPLVNERLTQKHLYKALARAVNRSGLEGDVVCLVNPRTWETLETDAAAKRVFDKSYNSGSLEEGQEAITYYTQTGKIEVRSHRCVKEGDALVLHLSDWLRSGSAEIGFSVPGMNQEIVFALENQAGYAFRTYSDQYLFCRAPARSILITGINDEAA